MHLQLTAFIAVTALLISICAQEPPIPYNYQYQVDSPPTSTYFGQTENGDQSGRVTGSYYVWLPDGRLMTVEYYVDDQSGFMPKITFQDGTNSVQV